MIARLYPSGFVCQPVGVSDDRALQYPDVTLKDACRERKRIMLEVKDGQDPIASRSGGARSAGYTVSGLADDWLKRHVSSLSPETQKNYEVRLHKYIRGKLGHRPIEKVAKRELIVLRNQIDDAGKPRMANSVIEAASAMFGWAVAEDLLEHNPCAGIKKLDTKQAKGRHNGRALTDIEISESWKAIVAPDLRLGQAFALIYRLMLLTGQRVSEVCGAKVHEFDLTGSRPAWTIPGERTGNKSGEDHTVPLAPMAVDQWSQALSVTSNDEYVFPAGRSANTAHIHRHSVRNALIKMATRKNMMRITPHDTRRIVRSRMAALNIPRENSERCLNHAGRLRRGSHDDYNKYEYFDEKLEAFMRWEVELQRLLEAGTQAKLDLEQAQ